MSCLCLLCPQNPRRRNSMQCASFSASSLYKPDRCSLIIYLFSTTTSHIRHQNLDMRERCSVSALCFSYSKFKARQLMFWLLLSPFQMGGWNWCQVFYMHHHNNLNVYEMTSTASHVLSRLSTPIQIRRSLHHVLASNLKLYPDLLSNIRKHPQPKRHVMLVSFSHLEVSKEGWKNDML